jgi:hypothetical protein
LPDEAKTQIRFPKAYARSVENLRYEDIVRQLVTEFTNKNLPMNYFTGESKVTLDATLQEAEVMFAANQRVKNMAESGELSRLHENFNNLNEQTHSAYNSIKDKINSIILATHTKEDEISRQAMARHAKLSLSLHNSTDVGFSPIFSSKAWVTTNNLDALEAFKSKAQNTDDINRVISQIQALLQVQIKSIENL